MISGLKPYPAYKDSGVPWLGQVPVHWDVLPALAVYKPRQVKNIGLREKTVLSLSYGRIVVKPEEKLRGLVPESFETYQIVEPGNIIIRTTDLQNDQKSLRIGYSRNRGIITSAYMCLEARERITSEFGCQFLNAYDLLKIIYSFGSGLRQNLDFHHIKRMPVLVPSCEEQLAIVRFLGHAERLIGRYISAKQKLIKLLEEQKQTIIHRAVARGLDPHARFTASGIVLLGDIPEHWKITRLKFVTSNIVDCLHATPVYDSAGVFPAIRTSDVRPGEVRTDTARRVSKETYAKWTSRLLPRTDDILYSREGERYGIAALVPKDVELCISQRMMVFRLKAKCNSRYIMWQLNMPHVYAQATVDVIGSAAPHVNVETIKNFTIVLPPESEQNAIADHIEKCISPFARSIESEKRGIALLRDFRKRLIADVVTGKLDVRTAAHALAKTVMETEPVDDEAATDDSEVDDAVDDIEAEEDAA